MIRPPRALVLSPSASHPQDYGNRNRVWQTTHFFKEMGYMVDFLLYPFETEWIVGIPPEADEMRLAWDSFWVVPPTVALHARAANEHHEIDEWWDPSIGAFLEWLFTRRSYDLFVVNYAFLSKAFDYAPKTTLRVLETHDVFTGRKEVLASLGVTPEFFYTTEDQERIALDRADVVIAIKDSEASLIEGITKREVVSLPFFPTSPEVAPDCETGFAGLSIGFIGAGNSVNVANFQAFLDAFDPMVRIYCPPLRLVVAGNVCTRLKADNPAFELIGRVPNVGDFYAMVDIVVAPMMFSTGIKIKVGEALAYGKGVVSTVNGFDGFPAMDQMHVLNSIEDLCRSLIKLSFDPARQAELVDRSRMSARLAKQATSTAFQSLAEVIKNRSKRILFVTDRPYWSQTGFMAARLLQWAQLCGLMTRAVVCYLHQGDGPAQMATSDVPAELLEIDLSRIESVDRAAEVKRRLDDALRQIGRAEIILSVNDSWAAELFGMLRADGHEPLLDLWCPPLAGLVADNKASERADVWLSGVRTYAGSAGNRAVEAMPLRWMPMDLRAWAESAVTRRVVVICQAASIEARWIEADLRRTLDALGVECELVSVGGIENEIEALYAYLQGRDRPLLMLAISAEAPLRNASRALSKIGSIPFFSIDRDTFPMIVRDQAGKFQMLHSCAALIENFLTLRGADIDPCFTVHTMDTGWSGFWRAMDERLRPVVEARGEPLSSAVEDSAVVTSA
jgi:hypothetical protein